MTEKMVSFLRHSKCRAALVDGWCPRCRCTPAPTEIEAAQFANPEQRILGNIYREDDLSRRIRFGT